MPATGWSARVSYRSGAMGLPDLTRPSDHDVTRRMRAGVPLAALSASAATLPSIRRGDLQPGDWLVICTRNSVYSLYANDDGTFLVSGGWFERNTWASRRVRINGCTFGGRAIKTDIVAAPGLFLEFDNRVTTTRIRSARTFPSEVGAAVH